MRAMPNPPRPLATAHDLAAYHARRERFYAALALLLGSPADDTMLTTVRQLLHRDAGNLAPLLAALSSATARSVAAELDDVFPASVERRDDGPGAAVQRAARVSRRDVVVDLRMLATLADETAHAIDGGDIPRASSLTDVQGRFLHDHACRCVSELAAELLASGHPFCFAMGKSLAEQIGEDLRLLASAEEISA